MAAGLPPGYPFQFKTARAGRRKLGEARSLGSIAYEIGIVATGGFGWAIFRGPKIWDVAGGIPIIREAGGVALRYSQSQGGWFPLDRFEAPQPKIPRQADQAPRLGRRRSSSGPRRSSPRSPRRSPRAACRSRSPPR